jgi:AMP nucleosidase
MECATLFVASYKYKLPLGALLMVSDLPLNRHGIKTKESAKFVYETYMADHVDKGVETLTRLSTHPRLKKRLGRAGFFRTQAKNS